MLEEDDMFLMVMNKKHNASMQCTGDQFEEVMSFFEETAQIKQPFAAVDNPPVLLYTEMEEAFDAGVEDSVKRFAKDIYEHWRMRRIKSGNRPLQLTLKVRSDPMGIDRLIDANSRSSKPDKRLMMVTHMCVSVDEKFARFAKLVVGMRRVPKN
jgi:hypothetical protein